MFMVYNIRLFVYISLETIREINQSPSGKHLFTDEDESCSSMKLCMYESINIIIIDDFTFDKLRDS